jgi:hypothetical protein
MPPLDLVQLGISSLIPALVALLNDPRPNRAWLRVLVVIVIVAGSALLHLWQAHTALTWESWGSEALTLLAGSQLVHRLLKVPFGKLEEGTGNGLGVLIDGIVRGKASADDNSLEAKLSRLEDLKLKGYITPTEYDTKRAAVLEESL